MATQSAPGSSTEAAAEEEVPDTKGGQEQLLKSLAKKNGVLEFWQTIGWTELHFAVVAGDIIKVKRLIARNPGLAVQRGAKMETALVVALRMQSDMEMICALIEGRGVEAINLPAEEYKLGFKMQDCCDSGAKMRWSPLHDCMDYQDPVLRYKVTALILESGVRNIDARDYDDRTPLIHATNKGLLDIVTLLVQNGARADSFDVDGECAVHYAARQNDPSVLRYLLSVNPNLVNIKKRGRSTDYKTPLHAACYRGKMGCVKMLLDAGASINIRDSGGYTPVQVARTREVRVFMDEVERKERLAEGNESDELEWSMDN